MPADIENPNPDGDVAAVEPSRSTFWALKEGLLASFLRYPNGSRVSDADVMVGKPPNGVVVGGGADIMVAKPGRSSGVPTNADGDADAAAAKPFRRTWRNYMLYLCSAMAYVLTIVSGVFITTHEHQIGHTMLVAGWIGVCVGIILTAFCFAFADVLV